MLVHPFNPCSLEGEAGRFLGVPGQSGMKSEYQARKENTMRHRLKMVNELYALPPTVVS